MLSDTIVFMTVRNRAYVTRQTLEDLRRNSGRAFDLHLYDDRSEEDLPGLWEIYGNLVESGQVSNLVMTRRIPSGVPWGKSYALRQFLASTEATIPAENRKFVVILDNDVELREGWLDACVDVLLDGETIARNLTVATPWVDPHYTRLGTACIGGRVVHVQREHGAACWVTKWGFFKRHGFPDVHHRVGPGHEEAFYVSAMQRAGESFVCIPDLADPYVRGAASERVRWERAKKEVV